jgi:two-component system phosphate regulon response regulator PhoB
VPGGDEITILVVDDEPRLRELMKVALGPRYTFLEAGDVGEALALVRSRPDLVLLDVMIPGGSGLDVLREIRRDPDLGRIPVVVVSAWQATEDRRAALDEGADAFLGKPFPLEELTAIVRTLAGGPP